MRLPLSGLRIDSPSWPLLQAKISYWGAASGIGAADGTTIVDANLVNEPSYLAHLVKVLDGAAAGQTRRIMNPTTAGLAVVDSPFTNSAGAVVQIAAGTRFVIISDFESEAIYYGTATAAGATDGSTLIDTGLATPFTVDDEPIGHTVRILTSATAALVGQEREITDYDFGATLLYFNIPFTAQVPLGTTYVVLRNRPSAGGGPIPPPEPVTAETAWILADYDPFDVADATADTERWSSEYISAGAADGLADINTTTPNRLYVNILAAALAAAEYGVRRRQLTPGNKWLTKADVSVVVANPNVTDVWAGLSVSRGGAWNAANYFRIYKRQRSAVGVLEAITTEYNLAGAGVVTTDILTTTQDDVAFKIERIGNMWRLYYSLTQAPRYHWILAQEVEDPTNSMTDDTSIYLSVRNPENAAGQAITGNFNQWELYHTLGNLGDIINLLISRGGALAYLGYCPPGMAASATVITCPNLIGFQDDCFNSGYQMIVLKNANAPAAAPEMEMRDVQDYVSATGTFTTEAFSAVVEASDIVLIIHNSVAVQISAFGIADAGSGVAAVVDAARTEANDWWNGQTVMMLSGAARGQKRPIADFVALTDTIVPSPDFDAAVAAGDIYVILAHYNMIVPRVVDNVANLLTSDVVGRQDDTIPAMNAAPADWTLVRQVKAILERVGATPADPDDSLLTGVGQRDAAATLDDLSNITTTDLQAKIRRALERMSPDAFSATIQGAARTELDTMLAQLATYFVAAGAAMALQVNGNAARTNLQQALTDFFAAFGVDGLNVFNPTIQGAARTDLDAALAAMATYFSAAGAAWSVQINGNLARTNLEQVWEDFSAVFGADGANIFNPTVQGVARTNLDAAIAALATYFAAAGAALSIQVNGLAARDNLEQALEDYFGVVGIDGINVFNPTIQGAARLTFEAAWNALATYISPAGAAYSATVNPGAVAKTTIEETLEDLGDVLAGAAGIVTFPVAAVPANGVSIAEVLRQIYNDIVAINSGFQEQPDTAVSITAIVAAETDVLNLAVAATRYIVRSLRLKSADPGANNVTVRLYELVNDVLTVVDTFTITTANFGTYFSLPDMFGLMHLAGDNLRVTVQATGGGPYGILGEYSHATAT